MRALGGQPPATREKGDNMIRLGGCWLAVFGGRIWVCCLRKRDPSSGRARGERRRPAARARAARAPVAAQSQHPPDPIRTARPSRARRSQPSSSTTDIADDSAIYANATAPELSVVVATTRTNQPAAWASSTCGQLAAVPEEGMIERDLCAADSRLGGQQIVLVGRTTASPTR